MKISIVVPVYKVEKYLERCVRSLQKQSFFYLEIILVDDGSPDRCPQLCDALAKIDERIKVIHQKNQGLAGARNTGIAAATGDFIGFLDSDDWLDPDAIKNCAQIIEDFKADVVQFQLGYAYNDETKFKQPKKKLEVYQGKNILQHYMYSTTKGVGGDYSVCVCLFKRELLEGIYFRVGKINEDIDFKYKALEKASILVNTNQIYYYYFQQDESISIGGLRKKDFDLYEAANELDLLSQNETYGNIRKMVLVKKARTPLSLLCKIAYYGISDTDIDKNSVITLLTKELRGSLYTLLSSPIPVSRKILAVLFSVNYSITERFVHFLKRM